MGTRRKGERGGEGGTKCKREGRREQRIEGYRRVMGTVLPWCVMPGLYYIVTTTHTKTHPHKSLYPHPFPYSHTCPHPISTHTHTQLTSCLSCCCASASSLSLACSSSSFSVTCSQERDTKYAQMYAHIYHKHMYISSHKG